MLRTQQGEVPVFSSCKDFGMLKIGFCRDIFSACLCVSMFSRYVLVSILQCLDILSTAFYMFCWLRFLRLMLRFSMLFFFTGAVLTKSAR